MPLAPPGLADGQGFSAALRCAKLEALSAEWQDADVDLPDEVDQRFAALETEIERIDAKRHAYDGDEIVRGGVFVILSHDGKARIERGFIRAEDEAPEPEGAESATYEVDGVTVTEDGEIVGDTEDREDGAPGTEDEDAGDAGKPLSDLLVRDLTSHRTLGLRLALGEQPDMALIAVTHTLERFRSALNRWGGVHAALLG